MPLRVYNTLTRKKEPFEPLRPGKVGMYVCGPTVYKPSHIGHMVGPVIFDTVKRYLAHLGYQVTWIVNITDVDDKLIVRAKELGTTVKQLAEKMTADYLDCLKKLNVVGIDHMPRATEFIGEMQGMIAKLIETEYAYAANGDVYFDIAKDSDYGKLCNRNPEQLEAGARIEVSSKKRNPGDFALWKSSKPGEPEWQSPWGPGRPGWHIECSAMSMKLLGETLDIHGGGLDLQFPHHENELAQSESFTSQTFARYWMHNGLLKMGDAKMAGSVGNVVNVVDLLKEHQPETVRFLLLSTHYRSPIEYSDERLREVRRALDGFYRFFERFERVTGQNFYKLGKSTGAGDPTSDIESHRKRFREAMDDDFNTGGAVGVLFDLLRSLNSIADRHELEGKGKPDPSVVSQLTIGAQVLRELSGILGIFQEPINEPTKITAELTDKLGELARSFQERWNAPAPANADGESLIRHFVELRRDARAKKNFPQADDVRKQLAALGVTLEDRPDGTIWRIQ